MRKKKARREVMLSVVLAALLAEGAANAGDEECEQCASSAEHAQQLRERGGSPPRSPLGKRWAAEQRSLVPTFIVGGIGVTALVPWAIFGLQGMNEVDALNDCKPRCAPDDVDRAKSKLIIADISLGISVVAFAVMTYMILTRPKSETRAHTGENSLRWTARPGAAGLGVSF